MTPNRLPELTPPPSGGVFWGDGSGWPRAFGVGRSGAVSARAEGGVSRTSEFAVRLERAGRRNGAFAAKELAVLSDGAAWIRNVCEEIFPGRRVTCVLDQFHALEYAAAAVQALAPDKAGRKARMEGIKQQLNDGQVARVIDDLKPHRDRDKAVAACIDCFEANRDRMPATAAGSAACRSRIRRRGKRLQADRRQPVQAVRVPLVESGRQRPARRRMLPRKQSLGRLP